jgi:hypothetical protein
MDKPLLLLPQFTYDVGQARFLVAFGAILSAIAVGAVGARLYTRYFIANQVGIDDYLAVGALVSATKTASQNET